jgi:hypothetical protein
VIKPLVLIVLLYRRLRYGYTFRRIPLTQGKFAIVDPEDYQRLNKVKWHTCGKRGVFYARQNKRINGKQVTTLMHRAVVSVPNDMVVDHINHNGLDNRKANLRPATRSQNICNSLPRQHSSRFKGVAFDKVRKKWEVQVAYRGQKICLGRFVDEIEAAKAYDEAAKKYQGEFAVLNFPD